MTGLQTTGVAKCDGPDMYYVVMMEDGQQKYLMEDCRKQGRPCKKSEQDFEDLFNTFQDMEPRCWQHVAADRDEWKKLETQFAKCDKD